MFRKYSKLIELYDILKNLKQQNIKEMNNSMNFTISSKYLNLYIFIRNEKFIES
jgi:hypothetical protein